MNQIKKYLGFLWILMGPAAIIFMMWQAVEKVGLAYSRANELMDAGARTTAQGIAVNTLLQWVIIIAVFLPIAVGMVIFGKYALQGEYDHLPASNDELEP